MHWQKISYNKALGETKNILFRRNRIWNNDVLLIAFRYIGMKGGKHELKKIAVSIRNRVFSESILLVLRQTGEFRPVRIPSQPSDMILVECQSSMPEILLMDVTSTPPEMTLAGRLIFIEELHRELPECKVALLCDEIAYPDLAREVMRAKQAKQIDAFFYASVTAEYLAAALEAL